MKFVPQHDMMDCGPACLSMIANHYGKDYSVQYLRETTYITREGVSLLGITQAATDIGFSTLPTKLTLAKLKELSLAKQVPFPCVLHWNQTHFVLLCKVSKNPFTGKFQFKLADPGHGFITLSEDKFIKGWF